mgnify:CR=1 FL=1
MNGFTNIYSVSDINIVRARLRNGVIIFCAVALLFAAFCAGFVVLFVKELLNVYVCFAFNFVATVAFAWYAVIYFKCVFYRHRQQLNFYRSFEYADAKPARGIFLRAEGGQVEKSVVCTRLVGTAVFLIKSCLNIPFEEGKEYDLLAVGNKLWEYKEADNA